MGGVILPKMLTSPQYYSKSGIVNDMLSGDIKNESGIALGIEANSAGEGIAIGSGANSDSGIALGSIDYTSDGPVAQNGGIFIGYRPMQQSAQKWKCSANEVKIGQHNTTYDTVVGNSAIGPIRYIRYYNNAPKFFITRFSFLTIGYKDAFTFTSLRKYIVENVSTIATSSSQTIENDYYPAGGTHFSVFDKKAYSIFGLIAGRYALSSGSAQDLICVCGMDLTDGSSSIILQITSDNFDELINQSIVGQRNLS